MTVHVLHAGDGYTYLTRQVASADHRRDRGQSLADYYTAQGNPPGRWLGAGLTSLGVAGEVQEAQIKALFGRGAHPDADKLAADRVALYVSAGESLKHAHELARDDVRLGRRFPAYDRIRPAWGDVLKRAYAAGAARLGLTPADLDPETRSQVRDRAARAGFTTDRGRSPQDAAELRAWVASRSRPARQAVAGYDLVFTPVKSASVLWALAPAEVRAQVAASHEAAVTRALAYVEEHAAKTRTGAGGIAQIDTHGLVAAAFDHRDSRSGDPNLHTHVAVSTKVQGVDGVWRSLDGRVLFALAVSASEVYTTAMEDELRVRLGVSFVERRSGLGGARPIREIAGVDPRLVRAFANRRAAIEQSYEAKLAAYRDQYGHQPDRAAQARLAQEATLQTRSAKEAPTSLASQRETWLRTAADVLGLEPVEVERHVANAVKPTGTSDPDPTPTPNQIADRVLQTVQSERSTWNRWHLHAEAERQLRPYKVRDLGERERVVEAATERAMAASIRLTPPELGANPSDGLRRSDGASVFTVHGTDLFTSRRVLDAETRLLEAGRQSVASHITPDHLTRAIAGLEQQSGRALTADQAAFARDLAISDRLLAVGIGPAGAGKTTALRVLAGAAALAGARVIALAPSARAAAVLTGELGIPADTVHKYLHTHDQDPTRLDLRRGDVLLVDEAGMAGTLRLDRLTQIAAERGATIRLVGDPCQLAAVEAGGVLRLLAHDLPVTRLHTLHRFADPDEANATLQLREGDPAAIDYYDDHNRLVGGTAEEVTDDLYEHWRADSDLGRVSLMLASRASTVSELSARARLDRIAAGLVDPTDAVRLHDGTTASAGDLVVTRRNDRNTVIHRGKDFVKNGDVWRVTGVRDDGRLDLVHTGHRGQVTVGAEYAAEAVELAYAATIHRAQGMTVDTAHVLVDDTTTREALYVAATRGRVSNHLYAVTDHTLDVDVERAPAQATTARDVVHAALQRVGAEKSATQTLRDNLDAAESLARLIPEYQHAQGMRSRDRIDLPKTMTRVLGAATATTVMEDRAWPAAAAALSAAADAGNPLTAALHDAADAGGLDEARAPAQLLTWRVELATGRSVRRAARTAGLPTWLAPPPTLRPPEPQRSGGTGHELDGWMREQANRIRTRIDELASGAVDTRPAWLTHIPHADGPNFGPLLRDVVAYRDTYAVRDGRRPLGPEPAAPGQQRRLWRQLSDRIENAQPVPDVTTPATHPVLTLNPQASQPVRRGPSL